MVRFRGAKKVYEDFGKNAGIWTQSLDIMSQTHA